jgi:hypothetical protein
MFNVGGLPRECSYLAKHPEKESNPKIDISEIMNKLTPTDIIFYNFMNNHPDIQSIYMKDKEEAIT